MQKLRDIMRRFRITYDDIMITVNELWETETGKGNLYRIINEKTGVSCFTLIKIISAVNLILKRRNINVRITPNALLDYEDFLFYDNEEETETEN